MAVRKIINNSGTQYTPVVMDKIVLDTVPTVGSFNSVTSDAVARAITEAGNVPAPEASDAGKVLGVLNSSGDIGWVEDQSGTLTQVQSDWDQTDNTQVNYIQHKPDLSVYAEASDVETALATKQDVISDLATIRSGAAAGASAVQPASLATVATTGAYSDLSGKPDLSGFATTQSMNTALAGKQDTIEDLSSIRTGAGLGATAVQPSSLAAVATTGDYDDLVNKPSIPAAQVQSDWNEIDTSSKSFIRNKPVIPAGVIVDQTYDASSANAQSGTAVASAISTKQDIISDLATIRSGAADGATAVQPGNLATVATTGAYSDLSGTPTIPVVDQSYSSSSVNAQSGVAVAGAIAGKQDTIADLATIRANALLGSTAVQPSSLATVATTGDYTDLQNKPSIPAAQVNSDWNSSSGVSQILNKPTLATVATTGDYDDLVNKPSIPAAQVQSDWSQSDSSAVDFIKNKPTIPPGVTVDQTYNASSTNAQSGTAVAGALASVPSKPLVAGSNITITENTNDFTIAATVPSVDEVPAVTSSDDGKILKASYSGGSGSYAWSAEPTVDEVPAVTSSDDAKVLTATYSGGVGSYAWAAAQGGTTYISGDGIAISNDTIAADVDGTTIGIDSTTKKIKLLSTIPTVDQTYSASSTNAQSGTAVASAIAAVPTKPIVAGSNITITENANNITLAATDTTYTAGNMIAIDSNNNNAIGVSTTAGITDIQQVAALPANPVSTVLYMIPET